MQENGGIFVGRPAGNLKQSVIRKIMEQIERIRHFEAMLDRIGPALDALESALDGFDAVQEDVRALSAYYGSDEWNEDYDADAAGQLPAGLIRRPRLPLSADRPPAGYGLGHPEKPLGGTPEIDVRHRAMQ